MSAYPANPPIQRLNFDILWRIFNMNADSFEDFRALTTTLTESHVCRDWRNFLLSSTSIWAHVMDLDHSLFDSVEGSREIIRRSGTALFWIKTSSYNRWKQNLKFIEINWKRIEKLKVEIMICAVINENKWTTLHQFAPHSQSCQHKLYP